MWLSAAATLVMEIGWTVKFFDPSKAGLAAAIEIFFGFFYVGFAEVALRTGIQGEDYFLPASILSLSSMGFVAHQLGFASLAQRPSLVLGFLLILGVQQAILAVRRDETRPPYLLGSVASFLLLAYWTTSYLKSGTLYAGLGFYMAFAIVHTVLPRLMQRAKPSATPFAYGYWAPLAMLGLICLAMVACDVLSFVMWPVVLLLGMMAIAGAWLAGSLLAAIGAIAIIMACFGAWLFRLPDVAGLPGILTLLAFFATAFFAWSLVVTRKTSLLKGNALIPAAAGISAQEAAQLPAFTALMPFLLLAMVLYRLPMANPSPIFSVAGLLDLLLLSLSAYRSAEWATGVGLVATAALELVWLATNHPVAQPVMAFEWATGFYALFGLFPFLFNRRLKGLTPWIASALAGLVQWPVVWEAADKLGGQAYHPLVPVFFAVPSLIGLAAVVKRAGDERRLSQLAWFGGIALFFITLIIPIQFDREWITLGWALEGAALLWLYRRVPHEGLRAVAAGLLTTSFVRLAMNPAVLSYHPRTEIPLANWYMAIYGIVAACCFVAARGFTPHKADNAFDRWSGISTAQWQGFLNTLGGLLLFLLLNIEIADYFSTGATITFNFSSSLAQDMTYSLAWAVFSIALLSIGIAKRSLGSRYASIALLTATLSKLFLHDVWRLGGLYRVASFIGLAVVLMLVSFLYQNFLSGKVMK